MAQSIRHNLKTAQSHQSEMVDPVSAHPSQRAKRTEAGTQKMYLGQLVHNHFQPAALKIKIKLSRRKQLARLECQSNKIIWPGSICSSIFTYWIDFRTIISQPSSQLLRHLQMHIQFLYFVSFKKSCCEITNFKGFSIVAYCDTQAYAISYFYKN